jgi:hypothetical protein
MTGCSSCRRGLRGLFSRKLGRCDQCVQISAFGSLLAWTAIAPIHHLAPNAGLYWTTVFAASALSLLFFAHGIAFTIRMSALHRAVAFNAAYDAGESYVDSLKSYFAGPAILISLLVGPLMAVLESHGLVKADKKPGDNCVKDFQPGPKFILKCKGECFPLFDKKGKKYPGKCKLIKKTNEKRPIAYECLCIYEVVSECKVVIKDKGKQTEHLECEGECPDLYLTDPTKDKKAKEVEKECTMIEQDTEDGVEIICICTYF